MSMEDGNMTCQKCGTVHKTLRLSLKKKSKKCFVRSKHSLEDAVGSSRKDWFERATVRNLQENKVHKIKDVLSSPPSQCSSQLTPDILRYHQRQTLESSPYCSVPSTFERLLSSQSYLASQPVVWSPPTLGFSPVEVCNKPKAAPYESPQDALIRSLGINANESGASWTSSLATPTCALVSPKTPGTNPASPKAEGVCSSSHLEPGKQKSVPRVLFSPDLLKNEDDLGCDLNKSVEYFHGFSRKSKHTPEQLNESQTKEKNYVKSENIVPDLDSMPLFSQDLTGENLFVGNENRSVKKENECNGASVKQEKEMENIPLNRAAGHHLDNLVKQEKEIESFHRANSCTEFPVKQEKETENCPIDRVKNNIDDLVKQETVLDALSDFFDPPSKSVGRRRCAPSKGKKRKSLSGSPLEQNILQSDISSPQFSSQKKRRVLPNEKKSLSKSPLDQKKLQIDVSSTQQLSANNVRSNKKKNSLSESQLRQSDMESTPVVSFKKVRSILSNEKRKSCDKNSRKRVTFCNEDNLVKFDDFSENERIKEPPEKQITREEVVSVEKKASSVEVNQGLNQARDRKFMNKGEDPEDLFSQVSPSALDEMCSFDDSSLNDIVKTDENLSENSGSKFKNLKKDDTTTSQGIKDAGSELIKQESARRKDEISEQTAQKFHSEPINSAKKRVEISKNNNVQSQSMQPCSVFEGMQPESTRSKEEKPEQITTVPSKSSKTSLRMRAKKFIYPTNSQIKTTCPKTLYGTLETVSPKVTRVSMENIGNETLKMETSDAKTLTSKSKNGSPGESKDLRGFKKFSSLEREMTDNIGFRRDRLSKQQKPTGDMSMKNKEIKVGITSEDKSCSESRKKLDFDKAVPANSTGDKRTATVSSEFIPTDHEKEYAESRTHNDSELLDLETNFNAVGSVCDDVNSTQNVHNFTHVQINTKLPVQEVDTLLPVHTELTNNIHFSHDSRDMAYLTNCQSPNPISFVGFSTAGGKKLNLSENALTKAKILLEPEMQEEVNADIGKSQSSISELAMGFSTGDGKMEFSTGDGKKLSEKAVNEDRFLDELKVMEEVKGDSKNYQSSNSSEVMGFSTAGGKKFKISENAMLKAKSLLDAETIEETYSLGARKSVNHIKTHSQVKTSDSYSPDKFYAVDGSSNGGNTTEFIQKVSSPEDNINTISESASKEWFLKFGGFQTAQGKAIELSEYSLRKARSTMESLPLEDGDSERILFSTCKQIDISEEGKPTPFGDQKSTEREKTPKVLKIFPVSHKVSKGVLYTRRNNSGNKGGNCNENRPCGGKNIFSDIFEEFQGCDILNCDKNTGFDCNGGFKTAGGKEFSVPSLAKTRNFSEDKSLGILSHEPKKKENMDETEQEAINIILGGVRHQRKTISKNPAQFTTSKSVPHQQMKSASTALKFPPGSNVPKGFRPFKAPKIIKPKTPATVSDAKSEDETGRTITSVSEAVEGRQVEDRMLTSSENIQVVNSDLNSTMFTEMFDEDMEPSQKVCPDLGKISEETGSQKHEKDELFDDQDDNMGLSQGLSSNVGKSVKQEENVSQIVDDMFDEEMESSQRFSPGSGKILLQKEKIYHNKDGLDEIGLNSKQTFASENTCAISQSTVNSVKELSKSGDILHKNDGKKEKNLSNEQPEKADMVGFKTASGKSVKVSEVSLCEAQKLWMKSTDTENKADFSTDHSVLDQLVQLVDFTTDMTLKNCDSEGRDDCSDELSSVKIMKQGGLNKGISSVQPKISENNSRKVGMSSVLKTASGKDVSVSVSALQAAQGMLKEEALNVNEDLEELKEQEKFGHEIKENTGTNVSFEERKVIVAKSPFQSASGQAVSVSDEALVHVKCLDDSYKSESVDCSKETSKNSEDEDQFDKTERISEIMKSAEIDLECPFTSASGKKIPVSSAALEHTKSVFERENEVKDGYNVKKETFSPFCSASSKNVSVSEKSLLMARQLMNNDENCDSSALDANSMTKYTENSPFQSASGKSVKVSEKSLLMVRKQMYDCENKNMYDTKIMTVHSPFQSASGKSVALSEKSLLMVQKLVNEEEIKNTTANDINNFSNKSPFQSASGKNVSVSEKSLLMAKKLMADDGKENNISEVEDDKKLSGKKACLFRPHAIKRKLDEVDGVERKLDEGVKKMGEEYEDLILPDDFFDDMETPKKRMKSENAGSGIKSDPTQNERNNQMVPYLTVPEGFSRDRQNFYTKPLQCHSLQDHVNRTSFTSHPETEMEKKTASNATTFRTPYKSGTTQVVPHDSNSGLVKKIQPVFVPKTSKYERKEDNAEKNCTENLNNLNVNKDVNEQGVEQKSKTKDDYKLLLSSSRCKQDEMIEKKKLVKIKPSIGRLYQQKKEGKRWRLRDILTDRVDNSEKIWQVSAGVGQIRASTASHHRFLMREFYNTDVCHVYVGDNAFLVPDDQSLAGAKDFYRAFLTIDGVDPKLINEQWFSNHYRWVVWKIASYEVAFPHKFGGRALTPENVMLQMKYRYDREVDMCHRSALRKIMERDDTSTKRMVLCVSDIDRNNNQDDNSKHDKGQQTNLDAEQMRVELTDGWYCINAKLDVPLIDLVVRKKIQIGHKICTTGAEVVGSSDPCSPLEAPPSLQLKICANATRPASWDCVLGFQTDPRPLCVPLVDIFSEGGNVGCVDVVLARKYSLMYMEKLPDGGCVFRSAQAEEKFSQMYQIQQQDSMEKLYRKMEAEFDKEDYEESCAVKRKWSSKEISDLNTGVDVYEAIRTAKQPDIVQSYLSEHQMEMLVNHKQSLHQEKLQRLQDQFQKAWNEDESNCKRNVVPLMKIRVVGTCRKDVDSKLSTIITVWRPGPEVSDLCEGKRYRIFNLTASTARSKHIQLPVQLTATRQTKFLPLNLDENLLDMIYEAREVVYVSDLKRHQPYLGEIDIVCAVINVTTTDFSESGKYQDIVYAIDKNGDIIGIKFWGGLKTFSLTSVLTVGSVFCGVNMSDNAKFRSAVLPIVEATSEFSTFTKNPHNNSQRKNFQYLTEMIKKIGVTKFLQDGKNLLKELLERKKNLQTAVTPDKCADILPKQDSSVNQSPYPNRSLYQCKMARLLSYGSPGALSPLQAAIPRSLKKEFKAPKLSD